VKSKTTIEIVEKLTQRMKGAFSKELGIRLKTKEQAEIFKWFVASILFGARISEKIVVNTYTEFEKRGFDSPQIFIDTGWDGLVEILDIGGYVRYDFKTATKLLEIMDNLIKNYNGNLNELHKKAKEEKDLEARIKGLGKGIGDTTVNIFLRELRGVWDKANPMPGELVLLPVRRLVLSSSKDKEQVLEDLYSLWQESPIENLDFRDFEASLLRLGKDYCRKTKCDTCPLKNYCNYYKRYHI
jgi:endonuclease III